MLVGDVLEIAEDLRLCRVLLRPLPFRFEVGIEAVSPRAAEPLEAKAVATSASKQNAFDMFQEGRTLDEVMAATNRAKSTVSEYLAEFIEQTQLSDPTPWVDLATFDRVRAACRLSPDGRLKPIFEALEGTVTYDAIRIALACLQHEPPADAAPVDSVDEFVDG